MNVLKRNNVHVTGEGDKVLLYAHGFGCNQHMWSQVVPAFAEGYRQVLFDYVGSGQSDITGLLTTVATARSTAMPRMCWKSATPWA